MIERLGSGDLRSRRDAANSLVSMKGDAVAKPIAVLRRAQLDEVPVGLKGQIIFMLWRISDKEVTDVLIDILNDENTYIRRNAAEALGKIRDERAVYALATSLFDDDGSVRARSVWALGEIKDGYAVERLIDRITDEKEEKVKRAAAVKRTPQLIEAIRA